MISRREAFQVASLAALAAICGCGGKGAAGGGRDAAAGAAGDAAEGGAGGAPMDGSPQFDGSAGGGSGDAAVPSPFACTLAARSCPASTACYFEQRPDGTFTSTCLTSGAAPASSACTASSDCQPGLYCGFASPLDTGRTCVPSDCSSCRRDLSCGQLTHGLQDSGGVCLISCAGALDCPGGLSCRNGLCQYGAGAAEGAACADSLGCADGMTCSVGGRCVRPCAAAADCRAGEGCAARTNADMAPFTPGLSALSGVCVTPCSGDGSSCPGGRCLTWSFARPDPVSEPGVCAVAGMVGRGSDCAQDTDCQAELVCSVYTSLRKCWQRCARASDCGTDEVCLPLIPGSSAGLCVPTCNLVTGTCGGRGAACKPNTDVEGVARPGCALSDLGTTCPGSACSMPAGQAYDPCAKGAFCTMGSCRRACLTDADCASALSGCSTAGTSCTGRLSDTVRYCQ